MKKTFLAGLLLPLSIIGFFATLFFIFLLSLPDINQLRGCFTTSMNHVELCPGSSKYVPLTQISPILLDAVVASEDASFYFHSGFDWHEIRASLTANLRSKGFKRGGSTISQQLVKNAFLSKEKSIGRKIREAFLTASLEEHFSKKEILERYLNLVELGPNIFGIRAASQYYFKKAPAELTVLESVFIAFLLPNPKGYHKSFEQHALTPFAKQIMANLLRRLEKFKRITPQTHDWAIANLDSFPWSNIQIETQNTIPTPETATSDEIHQVLEEELQTDSAPETVQAPDESESKSEEDSTWD